MALAGSWLSKAQSPFWSCSPSRNCLLFPHTAVGSRGLQQLQNVGVCWRLKSRAISLQPECLVMSLASKAWSNRPLVIRVWSCEPLSPFVQPTGSPDPRPWRCQSQKSLSACLAVFICFFETGSPWLSWNLPCKPRCLEFTSSCFCLLAAGIKGMHSHVWSLRISFYPGKGKGPQTDSSDW